MPAQSKSLAALRPRSAWGGGFDHGEAFGQHDGNYGHTFQLYEENIHRHS